MGIEVWGRRLDAVCLPGYGAGNRGVCGVYLVVPVLRFELRGGVRIAGHTHVLHRVST